MLAFIVSTVRKVLGFFAVADDGYKVQYVEGTAGSYGDIYCLSKEGERDVFVFVSFGDDGFDLSPKGGTHYVKHLKVRPSRTGMRNRANVRYAPVYECNGLKPLSFCHHKALADFFTRDGSKFKPYYPEDTTQPASRQKIGDHKLCY